MKNRLTLLPVLSLALVTALTPLAFTGCQATTQAVSSVRGEVKGLLNAGMDQAFQASRRGLVSLQFKVIFEAHDALTGKLVCKTSDDREITVLLNAEDDKITRVAVQVGAFGDEKVSNTILERIKKEL